jgi:rhodanese-related sulfurtransferase
VGLLVLCCGPEGSPPRAEIDPGDLVARLAAGTAPLVLDVRSPDEFGAGHIPGAVNIPLETLAGRIDELGASPSDEIVVHCERGGRAAKAETVLRGAGYSDVRDLAGHMQGWRDAGYPLDTR